MPSIEILSSELDEAVIRVASRVARPDHRSGDYQIIRQALIALGRLGNQAGQIALHGAAVNPVTTAAGPAIAAVRVAREISSNMTYRDMLPPRERGQGGQNLYTCRCGRCLPALEYIIARQEAAAALLAIASTLVLAPVVAIYNVANMDSATKMRHALQLHASAKPAGNITQIPIPGPRIPSSFAIDGVRWSEQPTITQVRVTAPGCRKAQAIIATLVGEHKPDLLSYVRTVAILVRTDGHMEIKQAMP